MKLRVILMLLLLMPSIAFARTRPAARHRSPAPTRDTGIGIIIGMPFGISGKYWLSGRNAIDGAFSIISKNDLYLHAMYLWHDYSAFPEPEEGKLPFYYGVGPVIYYDNIGVRGVFGIEYIFADYPFDIFIELAPVLTMAPEFNFGFTGGIGGRYFF